ncbi:MAG TPA: hypothetical protein DDW23_05750 [Planctomycetes bacterium]|nr:hypothetical protein [Planctomycetota bacterium]
MRGEPYAGRIRFSDDYKMEWEAAKDFKDRDDEGVLAPALSSYPIDTSPFVGCPKCESGSIAESPTHFECTGEGEADGCGLMMPRTVCQREMTRNDLASYFSVDGATGWIEDFISRKGRAFKARLVRKPNGRHGFEFPPREPRAKKKTKKG